MGSGITRFGIEHHKRAYADAEGSNAGYIQSNQNAGDGGTDVGAEDNAGGLRQIHDAGIDKAHDHHGGSRGGLNDHGNKYAQQEAENSVSGQFFQKIFHLGACCQLQSVAHVLHTEQERAQAAQQLNDIGDSHSNPSRVIPFDFFVHTILVYQGIARIAILFSCIFVFCDVNRCDPSTRRKFTMWYMTGFLKI